jgi:plasmid stabilization system protein ParE
LRVKLSEAAKRDRREADAWYRASSPEAASRFRRDLRTALEFIAQYPRGAPIFRGSMRGKTMTRFPFTIVYEILADRILVIAIADERRDPKYYSRRLG